MILIGEVINILKSGGIGVMPTDTIYGIVGKSEDKNTVERIYKVRKRSPDKPFIILISSFEDLDNFDIKVAPEVKKIIEDKKFWPGKVSIVFTADKKELNYLTRGSKALAFRMPDKEELRNLIKEVGPLVAPSANPEGERPAKNIEEAKGYFNDQVDFYIDEGELEGEPSTLIRIENNQIQVIREGAVKIV